MAGTLIDIIHEPEHYNATCGCTIPEAFVGIVELDYLPGNLLDQTRIMGGCPAEVIEIAEAEGYVIAETLA